MKNLVNYLVKEWEININYQDLTKNSAWHYACLLLKPEIAFSIKQIDNLTDEDKTFLEYITNLKLSNNEEFCKIKHILYYYQKTDFKKSKEKINNIPLHNLQSSTNANGMIHS